MEASDTSVHLELDARKFMSQIERWSPAGLPFKVCMQNTLFLMTLWNEGTSLIRELAVEFECSPHSVLRWANGTETPHFTLQRRIVASLHRELDLALSPASAAS
ncbi:MAG TPA: hypothetical protein VL426_07085 [Candidatus Binatia bacterium]|jgi:hypothetical protein|nr:hypothetical protein [Candidatus Binatia bacterium]